MIYDLKKRSDSDRFKLRCRKLYHERKIVELTVKEQKTVQQNRYLHLILGWFAMEHGYSLEYTKREIFKRLVNPETFCIFVENKFTGKTDVDVKSVASLTKDELFHSTERFRNWSSENGLYLPEPNEVDYLNEIEIELSKNRY